MNAEVWPDGACTTGTGNGTWCAIIQVDSNQHTIYGKESGEFVTSHSMEMLAALRGVEKAITLGAKIIVVYTDSTAIVFGIEKRRNSPPQVPINNEELWQSLAALDHEASITWKWVKGHGQHKLNNRAHEICKNVLRGREWSKKSQQGLLD